MSSELNLTDCSGVLDRNNNGEEDSFNVSAALEPGMTMYIAIAIIVVLLIIIIAIIVVCCRRRSKGLDSSDSMASFNSPATVDEPAKAIEIIPLSQIQSTRMHVLQDEPTPSIYAPPPTASQYASPPEPAALQFQVGMAVQALYSQDGGWYNAQIDNESSGQYLVTFVDFGAQEWLPASSLRL